VRVSHIVPVFAPCRGAMGAVAFHQAEGVAEAGVCEVDNLVDNRLAVCSKHERVHALNGGANFCGILRSDMAELCMPRPKERSPSGTTQRRAR
jgi:hypothetical protein